MGLKKKKKKNMYTCRSKVGGGGGGIKKRRVMPSGSFISKAPFHYCYITSLYSKKRLLVTLICLQSSDQAPSSASKTHSESATCVDAFYSSINASY